VASILRPAENREFDLTPRDVGNFYHEALEAFARENGARLPGMRAEEAADAMDRVTAGLLEGLAQRAIGESAVMQKEGHRIATVARRAARTLVNHLSGSEFRPVALEVDFGLEDGRILLRDVPLRGRIDRVDAWQDGEVKYLRVIDYKTGGKAISLSEVYYGLQLQLVLYLAAAVARGGRPAGVFYFAIGDPLVDTPSRDPQEVGALREKELQLNGLMLDDERVISAMSPRPEAVLGASARRKNRIPAEDFQLLMDHAAGLADGALAQIRSGDTSIQPAEWSSGSACQQCDFQAVCQFAPNLPGAEPRRLPRLPDSAVIDQIRRDAGLTADGERDTVARESSETEGEP